MKGKQRPQWVLFCLVLVVFLSGFRECGGGGGRHGAGPIQIVVLNFTDLPAINATTADFERAFFDETGTYRTNAIGEPVYGSVREWFLNESNGQFRLEGSVHTTTLTAAETWEEVARKQGLFSRGEEGGEWWPASVYHNARDAMGRPREKDDFDRDNFPGGFVVVTNAPTGGWAWGDNVVIGGSYDGAFMPVGLATHELGHLLLGQSDRYFFRFGPTADWDNMAYDYDNFPAHWVGWGRFEAGWADYDRRFAASSQNNVVLPPHTDVDLIRTFKARADTAGNATSAFFNLENRTARDDNEVPLNGPSEGVMLIENDLNATWGRVFDFASGLFETVQLWIHRPLLELQNFHWGRNENFNSWVLPYTAQDGERFESFTCDNGLSLNILGECLWDFVNLTKVNSTDYRFDAQWKVHEQSLQAGASGGERLLELPPHRGARRLYFVLTGGDLDVWAQVPDRAATRLFHTAGRGDARVQHVVDLDSYSEGVVLSFRGSGAQNIRDVRWVARPIAEAERTNYAPVTLRNGTVWGSKFGTLSGGQEFRFLPSFASSLLGQPTTDSVVRIVMSYGLNGTQPDLGPARDNNDPVPTEEVEIAMYLSDEAVYPLSGFKAKIPVDRTEPFVVMLPVVYLTFWPEFTNHRVVIRRGTAVTSDPLHVLSVDSTVFRNVSSDLTAFGTGSAEWRFNRHRLFDAFLDGRREPSR